MNHSASDGPNSDEPASRMARHHGPPASCPPAGWISECYATLGEPLLAYTRRRLGGDIEVAREVVQEAFAKLCVQTWPNIEPQVTAWLYKTCRHHAIDITRRKGRIAMIQLGSDVTALHDREHPSARQTAEGQAELNDDLAAMRQQIELLSEQQQELLRLRLKAGLSYQQISEVTGLTATNVGYHLHQAVTTLRKKLQS